jgi:hypothetical protein
MLADRLPVIAQCSSQTVPKFTFSPQVYIASVDKG